MCSSDLVPGKTLYEKIWDAHIVAQDEGAPAVLYIDAHLVQIGRASCRERV